jgi:GTPase
MSVAAPTPRATGVPVVAIVGRPNVGKSTLFNRHIGAERSIVHSEPGTTRDAVDTLVEREGVLYRFVDTAGLRRAARVDETTEFYGTVRTMRALERAEAVLFVCDATETLARQDLRIATEIVEAGRSAVVVLNMADATAASARAARRRAPARRLPHLEFAPRCEVSALTGKGVERLWPALTEVLGARGVRIPTPLLNAGVQDAQGRTPIPGGRVRYAVQAETSPPTIVLFGAARVPDQWLRYLERGLRRRFGFEGTPIRFVTRSGRQRRTG